MAALALVEAVDLGGGPLERPLDAVERALEAVEPPLHAVPARRDQVDEDPQVLDPSLALGVETQLDPLEPAERPVREAAELRHLATDGEHLGGHAVPDGVSEAVRDRRLELGRPLGERLERLGRALDGGAERNGVGAATAGLLEAYLRPTQRLGFHERDASVSPGRRMQTEELDYDLPPDLVAQRPAARRDESRLLVYDRRTHDVRHRVFRDVAEELADALLVVNDTRVLPARLRLRRAGGGEAEVLLLEQGGDGLWEALARPSRRLRPGTRLGPVELVEPLGAGRWRVRLDGEPAGEAPLPPYITEPLADPERYQTVYAERPGSAAAPTAGLHFTPELLDRLDVERVTLHVGLDTFRPVSAERLEEHTIHSERYDVAPRAWERIRRAARVAAVGTTTTRVLESVARGGPLAGRTDIFITPGFEFRRVDALLTNFHLPRSTLLALVMAFAGVEETRRLYRTAIAERYRFYSFGDAMLVL